MAMTQTQRRDSAGESSTELKPASRPDEVGQSAGNVFARWAYTRPEFYQARQRDHRNTERVWAELDPIECAHLDFARDHALFLPWRRTEAMALSLQMQQVSSGWSWRRAGTGALGSNPTLTLLGETSTTRDRS